MTGGAMTDDATTGGAMGDRLRFRLVLAALGVLTLILFFLSLTVGPAAVAFGDSIRALFSAKGDTIALIMQ